MKKINKLPIILISSILTVGVIAYSCLYFIKNDYTPDHKALAEDEGYDLTLNNSSGHSFKYHYFERSVETRNYLDDAIIFKYSRCHQKDNYYMVMSPGAKYYNPVLNDSPNKNGLFGMSSITVNFTSESGKLFISYGLEEEYYITGEMLVSGQTFNFTNFKPSHFELSTVEDVNANNDVYISSILIHYHSNDYYDITDYEFESIYTNNNNISISSGESKVIDLNNANIGTNNYININYRSNQPLKGSLNYYDITNSVNLSETIYLESTPYPTDFNTFLDSFRRGASSSTSANKRLISLSLTNISDSDATVNVASVGHSDRTFSRTDTLYISDTTIELGISLKFGGSISSVKNLNRNIQEYVDSNYVVKIRGSDKHSNDVNNVIRNNPNLINIHDVGREIQQSWYMNVDSDQGYERSLYNGSYICYNPVQGGDQHNNESQIVDYKVTYADDSAIKATSIWIKTKALDWAKNNSLSSSYMENLYTIEDGLIRVKNRFVDFSGWTNYEDNAQFPQGDENTNGHTFKSTSQATLYRAQELPAIYTAHPLEYFSSYFTDTQGSTNGKLIFDKNLNWNVGTSPIELQSRNDEKGVYELVSNGTYNGETTYQAQIDGNYHYAFRRHTENWLGFFNEDKFGLAVYIPANDYNRDNSSERHVFQSGMLYSSHQASSKNNRQYLDENYTGQYASFSKGGWFTSKVDLTKDSCYVDNTGYLSSVLGFYVPDYVPMEYTYLIGADYLDTLRDKFSNIQEEESVYNDFTAWKGASI